MRKISSDEFMNYYADTVADASVADRSTFIKRTYLHLAGAVGVLVLLEALLLNSPAAEPMTRLMLGGKWAWLVVLGLFMLVSSVAQRWASSAVSIKTQYAGLGLYVVAQTIILCPLLLLATMLDSSGGLIVKAGLITLGLFLGLTWVALTTKKDFSFMGGFLKVGMLVALGIILAGIVFGFSLGLWFMGAMILLMAGCILYQTSAVLLHYHTTQHVAASLALFASLATLFWYVLQFVMSSDD